MSRSCLTLLVLAIFLGLLGGCARRTSTTSTDAGAKSSQARKKKEAVDGALKALEKVFPAPPQQPGRPGGGVVVITPNTPLPPKVPSVPPEPPIAPPVRAAQKGAGQEGESVSAAGPQSSPRPGSLVVKKLRLSSSVPYPNEADAEADVLTQAGDEIERLLKNLDPPVSYHPSLNEVRNEFARRDSRGTHKPSPAELEKLKAMEIPDAEKLLYVDYDFEVTADQIRDLRTRDRVTLALRVIVGLTLAAFAGFLFLRADEFTKGYLTRWLAFAAVALAGGLAAALYFV